MQITLDRDDVLKLIDAGEIEKGGVTITLRDSRRAAVAALAWDRARPELTTGRSRIKGHGSPRAKWKCAETTRLKG